jgi:hypothetical protein
MSEKPPPLRRHNQMVVALFSGCGILLWFCLGLAAMMLHSRKLWQPAPALRSIQDSLFQSTGSSQSGTGFTRNFRCPF